MQAAKGCKQGYPKHTRSQTAQERIMAKQVKLAKGKEFHFRPAGGGQASKYPWDSWFDGNLWLLEKVTGDNPKGDFDVDTDAMPAKLKTAARRRYKVVQISRLDADGNKLVDSLIIKARDMNDDERLREDEQRKVDREKQRKVILARRQKDKDAEAGATEPAPTASEQVA